MENENKGLRLNFMALEFLRESAKWCKFLAIVGFIGIGLILLLAVFIGSVMSMLPSNGNVPFGAMKGILSAVYVVIAGLYFFPVYYLYKYATDTKIAIETQNEELLTSGLGFLKSHHKFLGIMTIVILSLYALMFVGMIFVGIFAASAMH